MNDPSTLLQLAKEIYQSPALILMPQICTTCYGQIMAMDKFRNKCLSSDKQLRSLINDLRIKECFHSKTPIENYEYVESIQSLDECYENFQIEILGESFNLADVNDEPEDQTRQEVQELATDDQAGKSEMKKQNKNKKNRTCYSTPCEICGKLYMKGDMKFHLNSHNGRI